MKILVVDDFSTMRRIVKNILKQIGLENTAEADDGHQALAKLNGEKVDFLITDLNMPYMDGLDLVKKIRGDARLKELPILVITTEAEKEKALFALKAGANNYIVKPFDREVLKEKIDDIFDRLGQDDVQNSPLNQTAS